MTRQMCPAGFWIRVLAWFVDAGALLPVSVSSYFNIMEWKSLPLQITLIALGVLYKPTMEGIWGATLGKMVCGIHVVTRSWQGITFGQAFSRNVVYLLSAALNTVGVILIFSDPTFQFAESLRDVSVMVQIQSLTSFGHVIELFCLVDYLFVAFTREKTALHDMWARTRCVYVVPAART